MLTRLEEESGEEADDSGVEDEDQFISEVETENLLMRMVSHVTVVIMFVVP